MSPSMDVGSCARWPALPLALGLLLCACEDPAGEPRCVPAPGRQTCVGVGTEAFVVSGFHTQDATCVAVWYVREGAGGGDGSETLPFEDLSTAAAVAGPGDCIALAPGRYAAAVLDGSVSLLGAGAGVTEIATVADASLVLQGGGGAVLRGLAVSGEGAGMVLRDVQRVRVEDVRVRSVVGLGIVVQDATDVTVERAHVTGVTADLQETIAAGLLAHRAPGLRLASILVEDIAGAGIVVYESDEAEVRDCVARDLLSYGVAVDGEPGIPSTRVTLDGVAVERALGVGVWIRYSLADVTNLRVEDVAWLSDFARGIEVSHSEIQGQAIEVTGSKDLGVFLARTTGSLADTMVSRSGGIGLRALYLRGQEELHSLSLERITVEAASNTAFMVSGMVDLVISASRFARTQEVAVIVNDMGDGCRIGDGLAVLDGAAVDAFDLTFESIPRHAVLLDYPGAFFFTGCTFDPLDQGIVVQHVDGYDAAACFVGNTDTAGTLVFGVEPGSPVCSMASTHEPL